MLRFTHIILLLSCSLFTSLWAQSFRIEDFKKNFSKEEWVKVNGNIGITGSYYTSQPSYGRQPWTGSIVGNVNISLFNLINLPFSINLTNSGINYTYPNLPNRFSFHPSYKWATLHVGDISTSYSPYTLSGHQFTGLAVDLKPDNWEASVMFGRMQRAVEYDSLNKYTAVPAAYKRLGIGAKLKYNHNRFYVGANVFLAKDYVNSLKWQPDSLGILPQQNVCASIEAGVFIIPSLQLSFIYGFSFLDRDIRFLDIEKTNLYHSIKAEINYSIKTHKIGLGYERIDPQYQTLGAYYFNNDLENITAQYAGSFWENKINLSTRAGFERNNLLDDKSDKQIRVVGSIQIDAKPIEPLQLSAMYSNFQTHQRIKSQFDYINEFDEIENSDTLNYQQVSHQADFTASYQIKKDSALIHNLQLTASYQLGTDKYVKEDSIATNNQMINSMLMYRLQFLQQKLALNLSLNYTNNKLSEHITHYFGPVVSCNVSFINETLRLNTSISCNAGYVDNNLDQVISNLRLSLSYILKEKHCFTLSANGQYKHQTNNIPAYLFNTSLSYSYSF